MPSIYAEKTQVPVERSVAQLELYLNKQGAQAFHRATDNERRLIGIQFRFNNRTYRFIVQLKGPAEYALTPQGYTRSQNQIKTIMEQEERRIWRALGLVIKAKFESVQSGIETFEEAFLPQTVLPGDILVGQKVQPMIERAYELQDSNAVDLLPKL